MQLLYLGLRQGEVQIIVGNMAVPLPVYFIYLQYAVSTKVVVYLGVFKGDRNS
ncbi:MAG: hypothetical protein V7L29_15505 [Nostoc sp.]|uniref:hypothetical protein n=1 Tax=Nostoc sp. TaxID=1180 RepID=UPI002FF9CF2C